MRRGDSRNIDAILRSRTNGLAPMPIEGEFPVTEILEDLERRFEQDVELVVFRATGLRVCPSPEE